MSRQGQTGADTLLTTEQVAQRLDVSVRTVERWRECGHPLKFVRLGDRSIRYRPSDIDEYLKRQTEDSAA